MNDVQVLTLAGESIVPYLEELGLLRIKVFYEFPYLYQGSLEYEKEYLRVYSRNPQSLVVALVRKGQWIGATTAVPLSSETPEVQLPFIQSGIPVDKVYYFGESVLLQEYRGLGYGHFFFDEREKSALDKGYSITTFCSVVRSDNHPLKPAGYRSNTAFWKKRGYIEKTEMRCSMSWKDRGEMAESEKELIFWIKEWK